MSLNHANTHNNNSNVFRFDIDDEEEEKNRHITDEALRRAAQLSLEEEMKKEAAVRALAQSEFFDVEPMEFCDTLLSDNKLQISANGVSFSISKDLLSQWEADMESQQDVFGK